MQKTIDFAPMKFTKFGLLSSKSYGIRLAGPFEPRSSELAQIWLVSKWFFLAPRARAFLDYRCKKPLRAFQLFPITFYLRREVDADHLRRQSGGQIFESKPDKEEATD